MINSHLIGYSLPSTFELQFQRLRSLPAGTHSQLPNSVLLSFHLELQALRQWRNPLLLFVTKSIVSSQNKIQPLISGSSPDRSLCLFSLAVSWRIHLHPVLLLRNMEDYMNILALYGSSFFLIPLTAQSKVENKPPHTPKFPPRTGARALIAVKAPIRLSPYGEFRKPLTPCHTAPPMPWIEISFSES